MFSRECLYIGRETLEDHSQIPKKANKCSIWAVASFSYVWQQGHMSAPSLHRESTSLRLSDNDLMHSELHYKELTEEKETEQRKSKKHTQQCSYMYQRVGRLSM